MKTILKADYYYAYGDNYSKIIEHLSIEITSEEAAKHYIKRFALFFTNNPLN